MTTPQLVTLPNSDAASIVMTMTRVTAITTSPFTLDIQAFQYPGSQWSVSFRVPAITDREEASKWIAFMLSLEGAFNYFLMGDPSAPQPMGAVSGPAMVDGNNQTGALLAVKGLTPNVTDIVKAGDYFQIGSGLTARLHMIIENADTDADGKAIFKFQPPLRYSPTDNQEIKFDNPAGLFRMEDNSLSWSVDPGPVYRLSFNAIEVSNANA